MSSCGAPPARVSASSPRGSPPSSRSAVRPFGRVARRRGGDRKRDGGVPPPGATRPSPRPARPPAGRHPQPDARATRATGAWLRTTTVGRDAPPGATDRAVGVEARDIRIERLVLEARDRRQPPDHQLQLPRPGHEVVEVRRGSPRAHRCGRSAAAPARARAAARRRPGSSRGAGRCDRSAPRRAAG